MADVIVVIECCAVATPGKSPTASEETLSQKVVWLLFNTLEIKCEFGVGQPEALSADGVGGLKLSTLSLICLLCPVKACLVSLRRLNPLQENARPKF